MSASRRDASAAKRAENLKTMSHSLLPEEPIGFGSGGSGSFTCVAAVLFANPPE